jgi:hypothetical protein
MGEKQGEGTRPESVLLPFSHPDLLPRGEGAFTETSVDTSIFREGDLCDTCSF